jgi:tryptophan synthase alpha subunit
MNRLTKSLDSLSIEKKSPALMTHVVLGYPTLRDSEEIVVAMAEAGASFVELQIPFSDPMADGPTIMRANEAALEQGVTTADCMEAVRRIRKKTNVPLLFMSYFNILLNYSNGGVAGFCKDAQEAGVDGLIVPDVPPEEDSDGYWSYSKAHNLLAVPLVSPVTTESRFLQIKQRVAEGGFIYCVSTTGTTGARSSLSGDFSDYLKNIKERFSVPLALGFGISSREQVQSLAGKAEIAIVGSAMIDKITSCSQAEIAHKVQEFTQQLLGK